MDNPFPELRPGDTLLYYTKWDLVDFLIAVRTWADVAHIEVCRGGGLSWASRNGVGFNAYPLRRDGLRYVLRPVGPFDFAGAEAEAAKLRGAPYGWADLLAFYGLRVNCKGVICSQAGDVVLRGGGVAAFSDEYFAGAVSPRDFLVSPALTVIWRDRPQRRRSARRSPG